MKDDETIIRSAHRLSGFPGQAHRLYIPQPKHSKPITDPSQLPMALNAKQVAAVLGISRAGAYNLMRSEGFPTLFIGKRMVVPKDRLMDWMNTQIKM